MTKSIAVGVVVILGLLAAGADRASAGMAFERVEHGDFGHAVQTPDGTIWSEYQGDSTDYPVNRDGKVYSPARRRCSKIGGRLPTKRDFERLKSYFDLDQDGHFTNRGRRELYRIFPDMENRWFWTSSANLDSSGQSYAFFGYDGSFSSRDRYFFNFSVLCVWR